MASVVYNNGKKYLMDGTLDLDTNTIKVALVTSSYTPNIDTHANFSDITNEVSGTGYTAGGATLTSVTVTVDTSNDRAAFDAADVTWSASTITARGAVVYKSTGTASTSSLLCYFDFGSDQISSSGNFTISWNAVGLLTLS